MSLSRRLRLFAVAAIVSGVGEGLVRLITRHFPGLHPAHKVSLDILWAAPLVNLVLFTGLALFLHVLFRFLPPSLRRHDRRAGVFFAVGVGIVSIALAPAVLHPASVAVLGVGAGVLAARRLGDGPVPVGRGWVAAAIALLAAGVLVAAVARPLGERSRLADLGDADPAAPNVIVLMLDTVRRDALLGPAGAALAPRLTGLARRGVWFDDAWSTTSWSLPSQASLLTGLPPRAHRADWPDFELAPEATTLAEAFGDRGYATGAFSGNSSWVTPEYLGRGFVRFRVYILEDLIRRSSLGKGLDGLGRALSFYAAGRGKKAPRIHREMFDFVDSYPGRAFFAYVCYMDVNHAIYDRRFNHYFRRFAPYPEVHDAYLEGLRVLDAQIGDMLDELERRGETESTIIVVTSDHGESFGPEVLDDREPFGHGTHLYPEQSRVPLFVVAPGLVEPGTSVADPVSIEQIPATLRALLGWTDGLPGQSLPLEPSPADAAGAPRPVDMSLRYLDRDLRGVAMPGWQLIRDATAAEPGELIPLDLSGAGSDTAAAPHTEDEAREALSRALDRRFVEPGS